MKQACIIWILLALGITLGALIEIGSGQPSTGALTGIVTDATTGDPIDNVAVKLLPSNRQTTTGADGRYILEGISAGTYTVVFSHPKYDRKEVPGIRVQAGRRVTVSAMLGAAKGTRDNNYKAATGATADSAAGETETKSKSIRSQEAPSKLSPSVLGGNLAPRGDSYTGDNSGHYKEAPQSLDRAPRMTPPPYQEEYPVPRDMYFRDYGTNDFVDTWRDRFSTFGLDVDDASYTIARTYLYDGNLPPADAIRVEEFVNHFDYGYNPPTDSKFRIFTELTTSPFERNVTVMKIGIKGREISDYQRKPLNLTLVIDVSGSMQWGNRLDLVKESIRMLIDQLDRGDMVGIVAYGSQARVVLDPVDAGRKNIILRSLDRLRPGGSTYAEAGLRLGYEMANDQFEDGHNNVVALCSDGVANVGQTSPERIMRDIKSFARKGITLSTFGVGMGNYNDVLLEQLAKQGNGRYAYIDTPDQARKLFVDGLTGTVQVLARDAKVQVEFNPETVQSYRLLGYENRAIADHKFRDNKQDGGELGAGHEVTALYEVVLSSRRPADRLATVFVRWKDANQTEVTEVSQDVSMDQFVARFQNARPEIRLAIVAERFGEMLKQTEYSTETNYTDLMRMARDVRSQMPNEQTEELVNLISRAQSLAVYHTDFGDSDD